MEPAIYRILGRRYNHSAAGAVVKTGQEPTVSIGSINKCRTDSPTHAIHAYKKCTVVYKTLVSATYQTNGFYHPLNRFLRINWQHGVAINF